MLQEITYSEWRALFSEIWKSYFGDSVEEGDLDEVDYFLDDGTVLFRNDWDGEAWHFEDTTIYPVYEDTMFGDLAVVGFSEF